MRHAKYGFDRAERQKGFTLLEVLIAITLFGLLAVLLFGGLRLGTRVWERSGENLSGNSRVEIVQTFLRRQLSQTFPLVVLGPEDQIEPHLEFAGRPDTISFVTVLPSYLGLGGLYLTTIAVEPQRRSRLSRLVMRWRLYNLSADAELAGMSGPRYAWETVLLDNIQQAEISYFGVVDSDSSAQWVDQWSDERRLPLLVRVRAVLANGLAWPDLVIAPKLVANWNR